MASTQVLYALTCIFVRKLTGVVTTKCLIGPCYNIKCTACFSVGQVPVAIVSVLAEKQKVAMYVCGS